MADSKRPEENEFQKARLLFDKGMAEYNKINFLEALNYFVASYKLNQDDSTQIYIKRCKKNIENMKQEKSTNNQGNHKSQSSSTPNPDHLNKEKMKTESSKSIPVETEQDKECIKIVKMKDYYQILAVKKDADENEIKKAYKKLAIKYHPDKNQSKHAEEAFKKISHAFQVLKDPQKKVQYDKYGSEEEIRERQYQQQTANGFQQDDIDPFDLFEMFFTGGSFNNVNFRRRAQRTRQNEDENHERNQNAQRTTKFGFLFQFFPLIFLFIVYIIPYLFQSKPLYQFNRDEQYYKKMTTGYNNINYYVGDNFLYKYDKVDDVRKLEYSIEREYVNYLAQKCSSIWQYKNELEYKMSYYRNTNHYGKIKQEYDNLDMSKCQDYNKYKNRIR